MLLGECSSSCLHSGATCGICCILGETNSVTCLLHRYRMMHQILLKYIVHVCNISGLCTKTYCGATCNTSICVATKVVFKILFFFSETTGR